MAKYLEGNLQGQGRKIGIIVARFNSFICEKLLEGALDSLVRSGVSDDDIDVARVPGAFEIPLVAQKMAKSGKYDAVICIGVVIRGQRPILTMWPGKWPRELPRLCSMQVFLCCLVC